MAIRLQTGTGTPRAATPSEVAQLRVDLGIVNPGRFRGAVDQVAMLAIASAVVGDWVTRTDLDGARYDLTALPAATLGGWVASGSGGGGAGLVGSGDFNGNAGTPVQSGAL